MLNLNRLFNTKKVFKYWKCKKIFKAEIGNIKRFNNKANLSNKNRFLSNILQTRKD